jgi:hypothetical protein
MHSAPEISVLAVVVGLACALASADVGAATVRRSDAADRPEAPIWRSSLADDDPRPMSPEEVAFLVEHEKYQVSQSAGLGLFGSGFGLSLVGIVFTVIDPYGMLGMAGFITVGTGVVVMSSGMFVLGLSRREWQRKLREDFENTVRVARGTGLTIYF